MEEYKKINNYIVMNFLCNLAYNLYKFQLLIDR